MVEEKKNDNLIIGINLGDFGSTGNIMLNSLEYAHEHGLFDVVACIPYEAKKENAVKTISFETSLPKIKSFYYSFLRKLNFPLINDGNYYKEETKTLINIIKRESKQYQNTIIHLHNIHMCSLHICKLYKWLNKHKEYIVLYTLHDCWAFTGGCYYYDFISCNRWQKKCYKCPQHIKYTMVQLRRRTNLLNKIKNLTLIPCSEWLNNELKKSKLNKIPSIVNNGEASIVPFSGKSNLKKYLGIDKKRVILSVSANWNDWKGIKYLYQLADILPRNYVLLLVGGIINTQNKNIIHIPSVFDSKVLAEYYSIADVFVSTSQSDNLPLVLMEAQICGVPVVGFGHGGTPEEITDKSGIMVGTDNDINKLLSGIVHVIEDKPFKKEDIISSGNRFKKYECAKRQLEIYNNAIKK